MALVVDDHLLIDLIANRPPEWLRAEMTRSAIYTTSSWYYRVASAAKRGSGAGTLSGRLARLDPEQEEVARSRIEQLPEWIGLLGPRLLIPVMAGLDTVRAPNQLAAEALALALVVDADIVVTVDGPLLRDGARDLGLAYRVAN